VTFQIEMRSDIAGGFSIPGLLVGSSCDVTVHSGYHRTAVPYPFTVAAAGPLKIPPLVAQEPGQG
jgi:hypothetical protein